MLMHFDEGSSHHNGVPLRFQVCGQTLEPAAAEHAIPTPAMATPVYGVPPTELRRQITPGRTGARNPKHGFQNSTVIVLGIRAAPRAGTPSRQIGSVPLPDRIADDASGMAQQGIASNTVSPLVIPSHA